MFYVCSLLWRGEGSCPDAINIFGIVGVISVVSKLSVLDAYPFMGLYPTV